MSKIITHNCTLEGDEVQINLLEPEGAWEEELFKDIIVGVWERHQEEWPFPIAWDRNIPGTYEYYRKQFFDRTGPFFHFIEDRAQFWDQALSYAIMAEEVDVNKVCRVVYFDNGKLFFDHKAAYASIGYPVDEWSGPAEDFIPPWEEPWEPWAEEEAEKVDWGKEGL